MFECKSIPALSLDGPSCSGAAPLASGRLVFELADSQQEQEQQQRRRGQQLPAAFASVTGAGAGAVGHSYNPLFLLAKVAKSAVRKYKVVKVTGDGRCMFRAMAKGLAYNQGSYLSGAAETQDADELRLAVVDALCRDDKRRKDFKTAVLAIKAEQPNLNHYCEHLQKPSFWGGEPELLVLSKMLQVPVLVYLPAKDAGKKGAAAGGAYTAIAKYGVEHARQRKPVRLLYTGGNHYDLLLA